MKIQKTLKNHSQGRSGFADASIYLIASASTFIITILTFPIYTRLLTPSDFGNTLIFIMIGKIVAGFLTFNLHFSTYRYYFELKKNYDEFRQLNSSNLLFIIIIIFTTILTFYFAFPILGALNLGISYSRNFILFSIFSGFLDYIFIYFTSVLTAESKSIQFSIASISNILLNTSFSVYFISEFHLSYMGRVYGILLSQILVLVMLVMFCKHTLSLNFSYSKFKKSFRLTLPIFPQMTLGLSQNYLDKTILSYSKGVGEVGNYSLGINFATILKTFMDAIEKAWAPFFFNKALENTDDAKNEIVDKFFTLAFIYMFFGLCIIYLSEEAIKILTTKPYYSAMFVVPIYVYYYLFAIFGYLSNAQLTVAEKIKYILPGSFVGAVVNIILNMVLISKYGTIGAAVSTALTALVSQIFLFYYAFKLFPLPINLKKVIKMYVVLIVFTVLFYPLAHSNINYLSKILIKLFLVVLFVALGAKFKFISFDIVSSTIKNLVMKKEKNYD